MPSVAGPPRRALAPPYELLQVGEIDPRKGQDLALEALARLRDRGIDARLTFAGRTTDPRYEERLRARARVLGLTDRVMFLGEKPTWTRSTALRHRRQRRAREWTPLWIMEALARICRRRDRCGQCRRRGRHGRTGWLVEPTAGSAGRRHRGRRRRS